MSDQQDIYIVAARRTPMGSMHGAFAGIAATELGSRAIGAALAQSGLAGDVIDEVYFGNVVSAGLKQAPARQAALGGGVAECVPCTTIGKVCGSGMKAAMIARDQIAAGNAGIVLAGGMENMTASPYLLPRARGGMRLGHGEVNDSLLLDGLEDAGSGELMGQFGQATADNFNIGREAMDAFAIRSLSRAQQAAAEGWMAEEITPVTVSSRRGEAVIDRDEQPARARAEKIPQLKPAFRPGGTVTAANASSMSDGAAALVIASAGAVSAHGLTPLARIVAQGSHAQPPEEFCLAPVGAIEKVLARAGWEAAAVDLWEINEAFAVVPMLAMQSFGLDPERVNINGGACALGHPLGASGARILVTLVHALKRVGGTRGVASLCIGGGEATAMAIERL